MYTAAMAPYTFRKSYPDAYKDDVKVVRYIAEKYGISLLSQGLLVVIQGTFEYLTLILLMPSLAKVWTD